MAKLHTLVIKSWQHFTEVVDLLDVSDPPLTPYAYRGQSDASWTLRTSLQRLARPNISLEDMIAIERSALREFQGQAHLHGIGSHLAMGDSDIASWWALMQHYGAPTRVLDWSSSPFVAAYFAVSSSLETDGAIFAVHAEILRSAVCALDADRGDFDRWKHKQSQLFLEPTEPDLIFGNQVHLMTDRMVAQQALMTISTSPVVSQHELLLKTVGETQNNTVDKTLFAKMIIPQTLKRTLLKRLRHSNIGANALFPSIDGLGHSVKELVTLM